MTNSFDEKLGRIAADFKDYQETHETARQEEDKDRQAFLRAFRDLAVNVILPIFEATENNQALQTTGWTFEADDDIKANHRVLLKVAKDATAISLVYKADYAKKKVEIRNLDPGSSELEYLGIGQLTAAVVEEQVVSFIEEVVSPSP
jgi:hypothetical protein